MQVTESHNCFINSLTANFDLVTLVLCLLPKGFLLTLHQEGKSG